MSGGKFGILFPGWVMIQPLATILLIFLGGGFIIGRAENGADTFLEIKYNIWKLVQTVKTAEHNEVSTVVSWNNYCHRDGPVLKGNRCDSSYHLESVCDVCSKVTSMRGVAIAMFLLSIGVAINFFLACLPKSWQPLQHNQFISLWWMLINLPILIILMITFIGLGAAVPLDKGPLEIDKSVLLPFGEEWDTKYVWHSAPFINLIISTLLLSVATPMTYWWKDVVLEEEERGEESTDPLEGAHTPKTPSPTHVGSGLLDRAATVR